MSSQPLTLDIRINPSPLLMQGTNVSESSLSIAGRHDNNSCGEWLETSKSFTVHRSPHDMLGIASNINDAGITATELVSLVIFFLPNSTKWNYF
jgi:hypothetical protein